MDWKTLLAYIAGSVDQELLLRNEYLATENRILRHHMQGRIRLSDGERKTLAEVGKKLGKQALTEVATIVQPDTILVEVLVATDFFTAEVWTTAGLVTYYGLFFIHLATRKVHVAGITPHPDAQWMVQVARHVTMADWGFLQPGQYLIHDRDGKYCPAFQQIIAAAGVTRVPLPSAERRQGRDGPIQCRQRLGGLLKFYDRQAA